MKSKHTLSLKAFAKVNIGLQVLEKRRDGYHTIHTVFQELKLHDQVRLNPQETGWELTSNVDWVPDDETNICVRAYQVLKERFPALGGVKIHLEKRIPAGAGLGGGSSDGAAVLRGLNRLYGLSLSDAVLEDAGSQVGADTPFFIRGGTQVGDGKGTVLTPVSKAVTGIYLLVIPPVAIDTGWAYRTLKKNLDRRGDQPNFAGIIENSNPPLELFENDFERIVIPAYPEIGKIKEYLIGTNARFTSLSGSGSTVFGIYDDETSARLAESSIESRYKTILTTPTNSS